MPETTFCNSMELFLPEIRLSPLIDNFKNIVKTKLFEQKTISIVIPSDNEYCNITKMDFVNITLVPLKLFKVFKFTINSHSIKI